MNLQEEMRINGHQPCVGFKDTDLGNFFQAIIQDFKKHGGDIEENTPFLMSQAYTYGMMQGKRQERKRRK